MEKKNTTKALRKYAGLTLNERRKTIGFTGRKIKNGNSFIDAFVLQLEIALGLSRTRLVEFVGEYDSFREESDHTSLRWEYTVGKRFVDENYVAKVLRKARAENMDLFADASAFDDKSTYDSCLVEAECPWVRELTQSRQTHAIAKAATYFVSGRDHILVSRGAELLAIRLRKRNKDEDTQAIIRAWLDVYAVGAHEAKAECQIDIFDFEPKRVTAESDRTDRPHAGASRYKF